MQVIYIDTLICVNLFIDYIILYAVKRMLHINSRMWRLLLGALTGAVSVIAVFLPFYTTLISIIYRPLIAVLSVLIAYGLCDIRKLIVRSLAFLGISMLACAGVLIIELLWDPQGAVIYNDVLYFDISPSLLICTTLAVYAVLSIYHKVSGAHRLSCKIRKVTLNMGENKSLTFESAVDTGCNLKEPFSGLPVIMAERDILNDICIPNEKLRLIPYSTAAGSDVITGFKPSKVFIDGKEIHSGCYIGICSQKLHGEIKSIMGTELSEAI